MGLKYSLEHRLATIGLENVEPLYRDTKEYAPGWSRDIL